MRIWQCGRYKLPLGHKTYIMGIANVTPDSFSGDGRLGDAAIQSALQMIEAGADILDIGGESTKPGAQPVSADEELTRVLPVLETLAAQVSIPLSVDTSKASVAHAAVAAGASIINDISAGTFDEKMFETVSANNCGLVLMHLRGTPQTMGWSRQAGQAGADVIAEVREFWAARVAAARAAGITDECIVLDAGFGFGKSVEENLEILRRGQDLAQCGFPILSGTSRKSTISKVLGDVPPEDRIWGTAATVALAIAGGCDIVRVHDVRAMSQVARVADAVVRRAVADPAIH